MTKQDNKDSRKIMVITEKDPNYINTFVTDAFSENTPNPNIARITFFEEFAMRPDIEISELDEEGRAIEDTTKSIFNTPIQTNSNNQDNGAIIKKVEKVTLTMSQESLLRLRDWLNLQFPES